MICILCERSFSAEEISESFPIPCPGHTLMYRFQNGRVHQFRVREKPEVLAGSYRSVEPAVAPAVAPEPSTIHISTGPVTGPAQIEKAAGMLSRHWRENITNESEIEPVEQTTMDDLVGQPPVDGTVVCWRQNSKGWSGYIRPDGYGEHGSRDGLYCVQEDLLSEIAPEEIKPGTRVRFVVVQASRGHIGLMAKEIEVYQN